MARTLLEHGFPKVAVIRGGFEAWRAANFPIESKPVTGDPPITLEAPAADSGSGYDEPKAGSSGARA